MLRLGIIGTNFITHRFMDAMRQSKRYEFTAVYSRKLETAENFAKEYSENAFCTTNFDEFVNFSELDVIYIASPNSLHHIQAKEAIAAGKHVIVEKPAFSNPTEMKEIVQLATDKKVCYFEAARNIHEAPFLKVGDYLENTTPVIGANFSYMKYSSRYDQVLIGEEPNIFSPKFSGGSLSDLGIYPIYAAIAWFGEPQEVFHYARKIVTGVDGIGTVILRYDSFDVTIQHGKIGASFLPSEIYLTDRTIVLNAVNAIESVMIFDKNGEKMEELILDVEKNSMVEEANDFATVMEAPFEETNRKNYEKWVNLSVIVNRILFDLRQQAKVHFTADDKEN